jgi:DNA helicase HerA-like ATPase
MARNEFYAEIGSADRVGFFGHTGSGKTFLASRFISELENIIAIDTKRSMAIPGFRKTTDERVALQGGKVIYRPKDGELEDSFWDRVRRRYEGRRRRNITVYIDEASHVTTPAKIARGLRYLVQAGREGGVGIWFAGQRPNAVNNILISEADYLFIFALRSKADRDKLAKTGEMGESVQLARGLEATELIAYNFPEVQGIQTDEGVEAHILRLEG